MIAARPSRLFLLEFNELSPSLLDEFMRRGDLPNFQRFRESSQVFTTNAGEQPPNLEPWVQWPTVHSGLPFSEHHAFHLGDGRRMPQKCLAEVLSDAGIRVGVFGSMNTNYGPLNGYVIPDPWDAEATTHPEWLMPFFQTVASQVQESSKNGALSKATLAQFGWFMLRNGMKASTMRAILGHLWSERRQPGLSWRRSTLLERLQYDLFRRLNRVFDVRFATLFCNSTAHFQHYYWRNMQPEQFDVPPAADDHPSLKDAILFGYQSMDRLLGQLMIDYPDVTLVLCTALSQQPWTDTTKCTFRPHRFESLLDFAGVPYEQAQIKPVMAEEFHLECPTVEAAEKAAAQFGELTVAGQPLMRLERKGPNLFAGCRVNDANVAEQSVVRKSDGQARPFAELFYRIHTMRSGRHHPDGVLWIRTGQHCMARERVPLTSIAPTVLSFFQVAQPGYMKGQPLAT